MSRFNDENFDKQANSMYYLYRLIKNIDKLIDKIAII